MTQVATIEPRPRSVTIDMADRYGMEPNAFEATVRATCMAGSNVSREHFAAFLLVAKEYGLNPLTKEIYAFPAKGGGIQPIVSIDGWMRMINDHPAFDGLEFADTVDGDNLVAVTCNIYRKDRSRPISVIEYMAECKRNTDVWRQWPRRMLRHKAAIQCARYAFGFSGLMEPDEYERMVDVTPRQTSGLAARLAQTSASGGFSSASVETDIAAAVINSNSKEEPHQDQVTEAQDTRQETLESPPDEAGMGTEASGPIAGQDGEKPSTESNLSEPPPGADGRAEREPSAAPLESLSADDRAFLGRFAAALRPANETKELFDLRQKFGKESGRRLEPGSPERKALEAIYAIESNRAVGELSIEEADARIDAVLT